ncbi:MAG: P22 coat protein - protein 5 domain protein [Chthonomonadales bacterium]|nr:P22 coat protein - protein 5 domain protein [Chthonomonadales bacterium]
MGLESFIPEVWSARLLANLHKAQVYGQPAVTSMDYDGDIREFGDTVRINAIGPVSVSDYTRNTDIDAPETLDDSQTVLAIDQAKYFNFQIDDADRAQQRPRVMDAAMAEAAYAVSDAADQHIAALYSAIDAGSFVGSDASPKTGYDASDVYELLVDLKVILDERNVPTEGRFCVIPPFLHGYLLKDDRFVRAGTAATDRTLRNGEVGQAAGFRMLMSNNVPYAAGPARFKVIAGHPMGWTYASQIRKVEAYRPERRFADAVKGIHLYGAKVVRPTALACLVINAT